MDPYKSENDLQLIEQSLKGDCDAFCEIVLRCQRLVFAVVRGIIADGFAVEDIAQDTFLYAFLNLATLREKDRLRPWLAGIARRKALRYVTRRRSFDDIEQIPACSGPDDDPELRFLQYEQSDEIRRAVSSLPDKQRQTAEMFYFRDMSVARIAVSLHVPVGTVTRRLHDARQTLKEKLRYLEEGKEKVFRQTAESNGKAFRQPGESNRKAFRQPGGSNGKIFRQLGESNLERTYYMEENRIETFRRERENAGDEIPAGFTAEIKKRIKEMQLYYTENGSSIDDRLRKMYDDAREYIQASSSGKQGKSALADLYTFGIIFPDKKEEGFVEKGLALAKEAGNGFVLASNMIDKLVAGELRDREHYPEAIRKIDQEMLPELEKLGYQEGRGLLLFWRARAMWGLRCPLAEIEGTLEEAVRLIPPDNVYQAAAVCGLRTIQFMRKNARDPYVGFFVMGEQYGVSGKKLLFLSEPGFCSNTDCVSWNQRQWGGITYFASCVRKMFFDTSMQPGEICSDQEGGTFQLISYEEALTVPAGSFQSCMHVSLRLPKDNDFQAELWYGKGIGLLQAVFSDNTSSETYRLTEYEIKGGEGYFPLAAGNVWRYENPELPEYTAAFYEWFVTWTDGVFSNLSVSTSVTVRKDFDEEQEADSQYYITKCSNLCQESKVEEAILSLRNALCKNTGEQDTYTALYGIDYLERFLEYGKKYRLCPSSFNAVALSQKEGILSTRDFLYRFGPYRWGTHHGEDRIFGAKPLLYLEDLLGCIWDDRWTAGYREENGQKRDPWSEEKTYPLRFTVDDGGTVTVPAGTFENCMRLTLEYGTLEDIPENNFAGTGASILGRKEYWLAPGTGIIRFDCDWGHSFTSSLVLTSYQNPAHAQGYFPLAIGCKWEYDETVLTSLGYCAKWIARIPCGHGDNYLLLHSQEFYYRGSEAEYDAFVAELNKSSLSK